MIDCLFMNMRMTWLMGLTNFSLSRYLWRTTTKLRNTSVSNVSSFWRPCWKWMQLRGSLPVKSSIIHFCVGSPTLFWRTVLTPNQTTAVHLPQSIQMWSWFSLPHPRTHCSWKMRRAQTGEMNSSGLKVSMQPSCHLMNIALDRPWCLPLCEVVMALSRCHDNNSNSLVTVYVCVFSLQTPISESSHQEVTVPPGVVHPATPENTLQLEAQESADR